MKKKFIYSLPVLVALAFNGCGSSSEEGAIDVSEILTDSTFSVVVERGAVLDANVTDADGNVAIQVSDTNNTYIFESQPVYPVSAEGGWIDVDGDGNLTETDVALDINLTSYSDVITPTTTYCSDENKTIRQERLEELAFETNTTVEDLLTVPSEASKNSIMVLNAVYEKLIEKGNTHSNAPIAIGKILERYTEIDNNTNLDENATSDEMALAIEEQTMSNLQAQGLIKKLNPEDIEKIKGKKPKKLDDEDSVQEVDDNGQKPTKLDDKNSDQEVDDKGRKPAKLDDKDQKPTKLDDDSTQENDDEEYEETTEEVVETNNSEEASTDSGEN